MPYTLPPFYYEYREPPIQVNKDPNTPKTEEEQEAENRIKESIKKQVLVLNS